MKRKIIITILHIVAPFLVLALVCAIWGFSFIPAIGSKPFLTGAIAWWTFGSAVVLGTLWGDDSL